MKKIKKIMIIVLVLLFIGLIILWFINKKNSSVERTKKINYLDSNITIHLYHQDKKSAEEVIDKIKKIFKKYDTLSDRYNPKENVKNLYYIIYNNSKDDTITIDKTLYEMLEYSKKWYQKSNGKIDVSLASVSEIWKMYRDSTTGVPSPEELKRARIHTMEDIVLLENNQIKNNHVDIDLEDIAKSFAMEEITNYLKQKNVSEYLIDINGDAFMGKHYQNKTYKIALQNPDEKNDIYEIIQGKNINVVTTGNHQLYYEYNQIRYHYILDSNTLMPANYIKSITIIAKDIKDSYILSKMLFLMPFDQSKQYVEQTKGLEAIWYVDSDNIIKSSNFSKYE